jgi:hypothetical protein
VQISEVSFEVCRIGLPRQPVHPGGNHPTNFRYEVIARSGASTPSLRRRAGANQPHTGVVNQELVEGCDQPPQCGVCRRARASYFDCSTQIVA